MSDKAGRILAAAEKLFASRRYDEVTLDQVSRHAGVGKGTIYLYFRDKEDLYRQVILRRMDELVESLASSDAVDRAPGESLRDMLAKVLAFHEGRRGLFSLMHTEQSRRSPHRRELWKQMRARNEALVGRMALTIQRGIEAGRYDDRVSPRAAAWLLLGMVRSARWHQEDMPQGGNLSAVLVDLFERGMAARSRRG